jgi:hypothetical protein
VVKKHFLSSSLALLIYAVICVSSPSGAAAASQQDDQNETASFLQLTATGPSTYGKHTVNEKTGEHDASHTVSIPVNSSLNAYFDFSQSKSNIQEITKKKNTMDVRTVFGFRITLK